MARHLYGSQTELALQNFPISGWSMPSAFLSSLALIKEQAAIVNGELGLIPKSAAAAIARAAREIRKGKYADQFPIDIFQTGSGTSTNMNMNEVLAQLANGRGGEVHPNDQVNCCQSSNDVIPTALQIACALKVRDEILPAIGKLYFALGKKGGEFHGVLKTARTHLMDAVPVRMGDEFHAYASLLSDASAAVDGALQRLCILPLGGTAVGTGINAHPQFAKRVIRNLRRETKLSLSEATDHIAAQSCPLAAQALSNALELLTTALLKIANDIRWMGSGPHAGLQEIILPALQPGSSIMPGKVNPVLCESVVQVVAWVRGMGTTVRTCLEQGSQFELNTCLPLMASQLLIGMELLGNVSRVFADKCIAGIRANEENLHHVLGRNSMLGTVLAKEIGYDAAAAIIREALKTGEALFVVAARRTSITKAKLRRMLDPERMV